MSSLARTAKREREVPAGGGGCGYNEQWTLWKVTNNYRSDHLSCEQFQFRLSTSHTGATKIKYLRGLKGGIGTAL